MANEIADDGTVTGDPELKAGGTDGNDQIGIVDGFRVRQDEIEEWRKTHGSAAKKTAAKKRAPANKSRSSEASDK